MSVRTPFPPITDRIGAVGRHQRRFRSHADRRQERLDRLRTGLRPRARRERRSERVPIREQLRADWGYYVLWCGIGALLFVVYVYAPLWGR